MLPDFSSYPATQKGARDLIQDLTPAIADLWKSARETCSDDLVAVIDAHTNDISLKPREAVCTTLKTQNPKNDLLPWLTKTASRPNGSVRIWTIIGFSNGRVCALPMVVARS
jgi:hypothetical protein